MDKDGFFHTTVSGDCAWSVDGCMISKGYFEWRGAEYGDPEFCVYRNWQGELCYANLPMTMPMLCKTLDCGVEIWSDECGCEFQEHFIVNHKGEMVESEVTKWVQGYDEKENGDFEWNPEKDEGGFEDYGQFADNTYIYGEEI